MPRNTKTAIFHTRYATHGSVDDNRNNHPVMSPDAQIALVHNGVIWNQNQLRASILSEYELPKVDTSVIPALLQHGGTRELKNLMGDAAVAWLDSSGDNVLHLARIEGNPVNWTQLFDGSIVWASTATLLRAALKQMQIAHGSIFEFGELDYFRLDGGVIVGSERLTAPEGHGRGYAASYRGATSGGHGTTHQQHTSKPVQRPAYKSDYGDTKRVYNLETRQWDTVDRATGEVLSSSATYVAQTYTKDIVKAVTTDVAEIEAANAPMAFDPTAYGTDTWEDYDIPDQDAITDHYDQLANDAFNGPMFYTVDRDGNTATYDDLEELEKTLLFHAGRLVGEDLFGKDESKWVNVFEDVGSFGWGTDDKISWVKNPGSINLFEATGDSALSYVKDGVAIIAQMVGR
jgi:hypothetical protein